MGYEEKELVFLTNVSERELEYVKSLLNENGISTLEKTPFSGGIMEIYMGMNRLGIDIYVSSLKWEEARDILRENDFSVTSTSLKEEKNIETGKGRKDIMDFLLACLKLGVVMLLFSFLVYYILF
ncbi:MAG: DUF2007 domain-containing protein [Halanaerobiaceae bacterium]